MNAGGRARGGTARAADVLPMKQAIAMVRYLRGSGKPRESALVAVASGFGLRISDALRLTWGDLLDGRGELRRTVSIREGKTGHTRTVMVLPFVAASLVALRAAVGPVEASALVFPGADGVTPLHRQSAWNLVKATGAAMGLTLNLSPHSLRKAFCDHVYEQTRDAVMTARITGHSNPAQLLRYIARVPEAEEAVWRRMAADLKA